MSEQYLESTKHKLKIDDTVIKGLTSIKPEFSNNMETFYTMESEGWQEAFKTACSLKITATGKRKKGDLGQDKVVALSSAMGAAAEASTTWETADGKSYTFTGVYDVKNVGGGDGNGMDEIEFDIYCQGKPKEGTVSPQVSLNQSKEVK